ncbi:MAG: hypothetical protein KC561_15640, partial [Myxococcales bacterium]|nr:hypothetical protein [Myxococcales bacterium]
MSDSTSNREKKRVIRDGVRQLKSKPGWDPSARSNGTDPNRALRDLSQRERTDKAMDGASECEACLKARASSGDATAL